MENRQPDVPLRAGDGNLGFSLNEDIKLDKAEDMIAVRVLIHVLQDEPGKGRALVRAMSPRDRAMLSFTLDEVSRILSQEEDFRRTRDRVQARDSADPYGERDT